MLCRLTQAASQHSTSHSCHILTQRPPNFAGTREGARPMNRKSILIALIMLLLSANGAAARLPVLPPIHIAATALTPPLFSTAQSGCYVAGLNGTNATPQSGSTATGIAAFVLDPADPVTTTRKLSYYIFFTNNTIGPQTSAEIRKGAPG